MSFITIPSSWIATGKALKQSLFQYIKDNFDAHEAALSLLTSGVIPNSSFENVDGDGYPVNWTWTAYTGGTRGSETTAPDHGARGISITSPGGSGNGGGYYDSDYVLCSPSIAARIAFLLKSTADIHNLVELRWYDKAKAYLSSTTIYDDAATNPTSWTRFCRGAIPPASAVFFKVRLTGGKNDDATAGSCYFDGLSIDDTYRDLVMGLEIAEQTTQATSYADIVSYEIYVPPGAVQLLIYGQQKTTNASWGARCRFKIGTATYSNESLTNSQTYVDITSTLDVSLFAGGFATLVLQMYSGTTVDTNYKNDLYRYKTKFV